MEKGKNGIYKIILDCQGLWKLCLLPKGVPASFNVNLTFTIFHKIQLTVDKCRQNWIWQSLQILEKKQHVNQTLPMVSSKFCIEFR